MSRMTNRWSLFATMALLAAGCAQNVGDINRVQPNVLKKTDLLGSQWYLRNTVTWTPATTGFTFAGETGKLEKLVFEVTETHLIGYRSYPFIPGTETNVDPSSIPSGNTTRFCDRFGKCAKSQQFFGAPVVAYPILSHFDIQRSFNPGTGEPNNVIVENTTDRPWNEREYIRVDWSANTLNDDSERIWWSTVQNPAGGSTLNSWIQPNEPGTDPYDWPTREYRQNPDGDDELTYFDFTGRYYAKPDVAYFQDSNGGTFSYPRCYLFGGERYDCTSQQIRMRTSLAKVDPVVTNDYEPLVYDNAMMAKFGYFRTERLTYNRKLGVTETGVQYLANRFRLWRESYRKGANGLPDKEQPIPFAEREVKPIVYYVTSKHRLASEAYTQYLEAARILEQNWDVAFRRAAAAAKGVSADQVGQVLYVCENPVPAGAPSACGAAGFEPRFGDLRYSFLNTIAEPVPNGLLGYGPSSADPETGEIISANANQYTAALESSAQYLLDLMNFIVGDKSIDDIISGKDVQEYILKNPAYSGALGKASGPLQSELQGTAVQRSDALSVGAFERPSSRLTTLLQKYKINGGLPQAQSSQMKTAAELLSQHPVLESMLLDNPELSEEIVGLAPSFLASRLLDDPTAERSLKRKLLLNFPEFHKQFEEAKVQWALKKSITLTDFVNRPYMSLAFREQNARHARITALVAAGHTQSEARDIADNEVRRRFQQSVWRSTAEHEIGHTFGLRHNFQGSYDALNYFPKFWDMKKQTLTLLQNGDFKVPRTPADLKLASDGTEEQLLGGMHDYEYSSIMDYSHAANADFQGVGRYDQAAILFAYSGGTEPGYVEVFQHARKTAMDFPGSDGANLRVTGAAYDLPLVNALRRNTAVPNYTERFHYSTLPLHFGEGADLESVMVDGLAKLGQRRLEKWSVVKAAQDVLAEKLKSGVLPSESEVNAPLEVPYMFCTDDHRDSVLSCNAWDRGPDYYEMTKTWLESYWNGYFFTHFKRDRYSFDPGRAMNASYFTFTSTSLVYKHWVHAMFGRTSGSQQTLNTYRTGPLGYDATLQDYWTMATFDGINNLLRVMSVPPAGFYMRHKPDGVNDRWEVVSQGDEFDNLNDQGQQVLSTYYAAQFNADSFAVLPRGEARRMYSRYDYKSGAGFFRRMVEAGHYNDQFGAMFAAVTPEASFLGVDDYADLNRYAIPYYLVFNKELGATFGALWSQDEAKVRPTMSFTKNNAGQYTRTPELHFQVKVRGEDFIQGFEYPRFEAPVTDPNSKSAPTEIQMTWTSRIYALYLGMALFSVNYDLDYAKQNQVFKVGGAEQVTVTPGYHTVQVHDVTTGSTYVALEKDGDETRPDKQPSVRMINLANNYLRVVEDPRLDLPASQHGNPLLLEQKRQEYLELFRDVIRDLDLMRGMYSIYGKPF